MRRLPDAASRGKSITLELEGEPVSAIEGEPVACSLIAAGESVLARSIKYHRARGPYCFSGACSHCLMRVDGLPNVYTCRVPARDGMKLERQNAYPSAKVDVFEVIDWFFPKGLDHHEMFAGVPVAEQVMARVARQLAGLGLLPAAPAPDRAPVETVRVRVAVVGAGAAGLAAAHVLAEKGVPFLVLERDNVLGGRLFSGAPEADMPAVPEGALPAGSVRPRVTAIGLFDDDAGRFLAAVVDGPEGLRLLKVYAERYLLAPGGHPPMLPFENNDLPGVYSGQAASLLVRRHGVAPETAALVGSGPWLYALARLMAERGTKVVAVVDVKGPPPADAPAQAVHGREPKAHGGNSVRAFSYEDASKGRRVKVACEAVLVAVGPSPSFELARQGGAKVAFDEAREVFAVVADGNGLTAAPDVYVAGDVRGGRSAAEAVADGRHVAGAIAASLAASPSASPSGGVS